MRVMARKPQRSYDVEPAFALRATAGRPDRAHYLLRRGGVACALHVAAGLMHIRISQSEWIPDESFTNSSGAALVEPDRFAE
jgi:hypothetical protein